MKKILVVDDSATARALFKVCMSGHPEYTIIDTNDVKKAIDMAVREKPFLIVLDYNMPDLEGPKLAKAMQDKGVEGPFVLMSANTQHSVIEEVTEQGFIAVLEKPISVDAIESLLEKLS